MMTADTLTAAVAPPAAVATPPAPRRREVPRRFAWFARRPGLVLSFAAIIVVIAWSVVPGWFTSIDPLLAVPADRLQPPGPLHLLGTDNLGRDVYSRVVHGAGRSLYAVAIAIAISLVGGAIVGLLAGFFGGILDEVLMRAADVVLSIPGLLVALMVITALGGGTVNIAIAIGLGSIAGLARITRSEVLRVRNSLYVEASRVSGSKWPTIVFRHVLPNAIGPIVVLSTLEFGGVILAISGLSFLGFGASPPLPEWGSMIAEGRTFLPGAWWLTTAPGVVIIIIVLATNRISRAIDNEWRSH